MDMVFVLLRSSHPGKEIHSVHSSFVYAAAEAYFETNAYAHLQKVYWAPVDADNTLWVSGGSLELHVNGSSTGYRIEWHEVEA